MWQDYDTAVSTLRLLAGDLKQDKAWRQYAAAQEMIGLATFMAHGPVSEASAAFKEAFFRYNTGAAPRRTHPSSCEAFPHRRLGGATAGAPADVAARKGARHQ